MPLSARVSPAAQRVIRDAFTELERVISEKDKADFAGTTLDAVIKAAHDIEDQLAARQLLRNMRRLVPMFDGLQYYSKSIEVVCNGTPYLPWIWAPIKVILRVASDFVEAFDSIITAYARIAEPLARFKLLHQAFHNNMEIQQTLAMFYADILRFHKEAYKFVRRGSWKVFFMTSWGRFQRRFDCIIEDLKAHEGLVDKTANVVGLVGARKMREDLEALRRESLDKVATEEKERTASQYIAIVGWLKMDDTEQAKIFETITAEPLKYPETCDWILRNDRMAGWLRCTQESTFLVLHGHPGTGKSVLATRITTFLRSSGNSLVVSHVCTYSQSSSTEYEQILRSILLQLLRSNDDLVAYIFEEFILRKKGVTTQAIESLIIDVVGAVSDNPSQPQYVHIVLDGLDECDREKQLKIIKLLERLVATSSTSTSTVCKVLVSTRMPPVVAKKLKQKHMVSLSKEKEALGRGITLYADHKLGVLRSQMGITDGELETIKLRLATKADGMFLWARLVLEYLTTNMFVRKSEVIDAVETLPEKLSDFYRQILTRLISHFDKRSVARLQSILGWIAFAKRPLRKAELRSALSYSADMKDVHVEELAPEYLFDMCAPLVEEHSNSTFAFIHVSVKEFLQGPESNVILDENCAAYEQGLATASCLLSGLRDLRPYPEQNRLHRVVQGFHGLHVYASEYWSEYLLSIASTTTGIDTHSAFFLRSNELCEALASTCPIEEQTQDKSAVDDRLRHIEKHHSLWSIAAATASECVAKPFDGRQRSDAVGKIISLSTLLDNYQHTVKALLQMRSLPGISIQHLERFKKDFASAAFTCRFWSCPLGSTGFETEALRDEHEDSHAPRISCEVEKCHYPPFSSTQALKSHQKKHHAQSLPRRAIRDPRAVGSKANPRTPPVTGSAYARLAVAKHYQELQSHDLSSSTAPPHLLSPERESKTRERKYAGVAEETLSNVESATNNIETSISEFISAAQAPWMKSMRGTDQDTLLRLTENHKKMAPPNHTDPSRDTDNAFLKFDNRGETKISREGELYRGQRLRRFRLKTFRFNAKGQGIRVYVFAQECAQILGYGTVEQLCSCHQTVQRIIIQVSAGELSVLKRWHGMDPQDEGLLSAYSMFRHFGHHIIEGGEPFVDDYWESFMRGEYADDASMYR